MQKDGSPPPLPGTARAGHLVAEFILLFVILPFAVACAARSHIAIYLLWAVAAISFVVLMRDAAFDRGIWTRTASCRRLIWPVCRRFILLSCIMTILLALWRPELLLAFPRLRPGIWARVMVLYPLLSVVPQTIIYRAFLFHRYRILLTTPRKRILVSALAFSIVHVVFWNAWAILFTVVGGYLFAKTYERSQSVPLSVLEHSLYGCFLFSIGWGYYLSSAGSSRLAALAASAGL